MNRLLLSSSLLLTCLLPSCVQYYRLPEGYTGPTARIINTGEAQDAFKSSVFQVSKIDGKIVPTSPMQTPYGGGPVVTMGDSSVEVPANQPTQIEITGGDRFAADGAALAYGLSGNVSKTATETFTFTPKRNATYVVRGQLGKQASQVWMEDKSTGRRLP